MARRPRIKHNTRKVLAQELSTRATTSTNTSETTPNASTTEIEVADRDDVRPTRLYTKSNGRDPGSVNGDPASQLSHEHRKMLNQRDNWRKKIPILIAPYLTLLHDTHMLRDEPPFVVSSCSCKAKFFKTIFRLDFKSCGLARVTFCACRPLAQAIVQMGLFPSAPEQPTTAFHMDVLNYAMGIFSRSAPNRSAFLETMMYELHMKSYKTPSLGVLQKHFRNALRWFSELKIQSDLHLTRTVRPATNPVQDGQPQDYLTSENNEDVFVDEDVNLSSGSNNPGHPTRAIETPESARSSQISVITNGQINEQDRHSNYLRICCPLCFGLSKVLHQSILVQIDACFAQKNRTQRWDPPFAHAESRFLSVEELEAARIFVDEKQKGTKTKKQSRGKKRKKRTQQELEDDVDDVVEEGMPIPNSVLDKCQTSFIAADETRKKADSAHFQSTGLVALLCRHDNPIFIADMTTPGERQFYVVALLKKLLQHIHSSSRIGILYDIGCQFHRSALKHDYFGDDLLRMFFGVAVFHAFGHQWICQLFYHPRKREGFGLTDGEGCERLWASLKRLISWLMVCAPNLRRFTLDEQMHFHHNQRFLILGEWLNNQYAQVKERKHSAEVTLKELESVNIYQEELRSEWKLQLAEQTKPAKRITAKSTAGIINALLKAKDTLQIAEENLKRINDGIVSGDAQEDSDFSKQADAKKAVEAAEKAVKKHSDALGTNSIEALTLEANKEYFITRRQARGKRDILLKRLMDRHRELDNLDRPYMSDINKHKLRNHAQAQSKKRDPHTTDLAKQYNTLCSKLADLIERKRAPVGAVAPMQIPLQGLFSMDVDHEIWLEGGLGDVDDVPKWMSDGDIRKGIKAMIDLDRCVEEESRIALERTAMQEWFAEEWRLLNQAITNADTACLSYHLTQRKRSLYKVYEKWTSDLNVVREPKDLTPWGPTTDDQDLHIDNTFPLQDVCGCVKHPVPMPVGAMLEEEENGNEDNAEDESDGDDDVNSADEGDDAVALNMLDNLDIGRTLKDVAGGEFALGSDEDCHEPPPGLETRPQKKPRIAR